MKDKTSRKTGHTKRSKRTPVIQGGAVEEVDNIFEKEFGQRDHQEEKEKGKGVRFEGSFSK